MGHPITVTEKPTRREGVVRFELNRSLTGMGHERYLATGLAASAQLGMPAAAASLGLSTGLLGPADAAALVAGGCLTLIPATIGSLLLARGAVAPSATPHNRKRSRDLDLRD